MINPNQFNRVTVIEATIGKEDFRGFAWGLPGERIWGVANRGYDVVYFNHDNAVEALQDIARETGERVIDKGSFIMVFRRGVEIPRGIANQVTVADIVIEQEEIEYQGRTFKVFPVKANWLQK